MSDLLLNPLLHTGHLWFFSFECKRRCLFMFGFSLNVFLHTEHWKGRSSKWIRWCEMRLQRFANRFPHSPHSWRFTSSWIGLCFARFERMLNAFPQISQTNGFSPSWLRSWSARSHLRRNALPQETHWWRLSLVCVCLWRDRFDWSLNVFPHISQENGRSLVCDRRWLSNVDIVVKVLSHMSHINGLSSMWVCLCFDTALRVANAFPHRVQRKGFSWLCMRCRWLTRSLGRRNDFSHSGHWCGFTSLWTSLWRLKFDRYVNVWPQMEHSWGLSPKCEFMCSCRYSGLWKPFPQMPHVVTLSARVLAFFTEPAVDWVVSFSELPALPSCSHSSLGITSSSDAVTGNPAGSISAFCVSFFATAVSSCAPRGKVSSTFSICTYTVCPSDFSWFGSPRVLESAVILGRTGLLSVGISSISLFMRAATYI